jgi:aminoglycoside 6'-N-acetyltransferase
MLLQGEQVYLRPMQLEDLAEMETHANDITYQTEYNFFALQSFHSRERKFQEEGMLSAQHGTLMIVARVTDLTVGDVSYRQVGYGPGPMNIAYQIGILLDPVQRGKGYGVEAQRLIAEYLFAVYPIMRVEASTDLTNLAEQRALEKAGFIREGALRKSQWRNGDWHDMLMYSKLRGE